LVGFMMMMFGCCWFGFQGCKETPAAITLTGAGGDEVEDRR
jgi:hypothetical protein